MRGREASAAGVAARAAIPSRAYLLAPASVLGLASLLALASFLALAPPAAGQSWRTVTMSRQAQGQESLDVSVEYGDGRLDLGVAEPGLLYSMRLRYDEERYEPEAELDGDDLRIGVEALGRNIRLDSDRRDHGEMELRLTREIPMELRLELGAVRADVDLGGLTLTDLHLGTGASEARIDVSSPNRVVMDRATLEVGAADFSARRLGNLNAREIDVSAGVGKVTLELTGSWTHDADISVKVGLGSLELRVPRGLGVRIEKKTFLTSFDADDFVKRDGAYYSRDWAEAERRISIDVDAAFGSVDVVWVR